MKILVTGAAGFIGSAVTQHLIEDGYEVVAMDNFKNGWRKAVHPSAKLREGDLLDRPFMNDLLKSEAPDAVVHLGAEALVEESVQNPGLHYRVNLTGGINLLDAMTAAGVKRLVFSSTAAVYGEPDAIPITEDTPKNPVNPYGQSKLGFEMALPWYAGAHGLKHITFRYFNACGATSDFGEFRTHETHIIPLLFEAVLGHRKQFKLFGTDYDTPDGTCLRDYVHVSDIARAHILGLQKIDAIGAGAYNLGSGKGFSNREVVAAVKRVTSTDFPVIDADRRAGDPAQLVASHDRAKADLGWTPQFADIDSMVRSAWDWRQAHPKGYGD